MTLTIEKLIEREVFQNGGELYSKLEENHILSDLWGNIFLQDGELHALIDGFDDMSEEEQEMAIEELSDNGEDYQEIYEHWIVSQWLYEQLERVGAPVLEYAGIHFYGRTESGQSLAMDHYLNKVVNR